MTQGLAAAQAGSLMMALSVFLDVAGQSQTIANELKPLVQGAITLMQILFPLIAVFRIVYRFAESREGNMTILLTEIVIIIFIALVLGQVLKTIVGTL
jgi:hypothetical protein